MLFDFVRDGSAVSRWYAQDDRVMGGVSQSQLVRTTAGAAFEGVVSLEEGGGFASVRSRPFVPPLNLSDAEGVALTVRGDGHRYKFVLRNDEGFGAPSFMAVFEAPAGVERRVVLEWTDFVASFRGRPVRARLDPSAISSCGFMRSKIEPDGSDAPGFEAGAFRLEVQTIEARRTSH